MLKFIYIIFIALKIKKGVPNRNVYLSPYKTIPFFSRCTRQLYIYLTTIHTHLFIYIIIIIIIREYSLFTFIKLTELPTSYPFIFIFRFSGGCHASSIPQYGRRTSPFLFLSLFFSLRVKST